MDIETARSLFEKGGILVLLDVPPGTEIGIDMHSWQTDVNFKGIKMIPPGIHFIYFSSVGKMGDASPRTGFFQNFEEESLHVRRWDQQSESLTAEITDSQLLDRLQSNKKELDQFCGPYPFESYTKWVGLSQHMSQALVEKIQPLCGMINSVVSLESVPSDSASRAAKMQTDQIPLEKLNADNLMGDMKQSSDTVMHYSQINRFQINSSPAMLTHCAMDSSVLLEELLTSLGWQNTLGELQMSFLCFIIGQQLDSFDQWKKFVFLVCSCQEAVSHHERFYMEFVSTLHFQLKEVPSDFFVDIVSKDNFLTMTIHNLLLNVSESSASQKLKDRVSKFGAHLTKHFGWDFESEPDEYAPVIVDENGQY